MVGGLALERLLLSSLAPCGCRLGAGAPPAELSPPLWVEVGAPCGVTGPPPLISRGAHANHRRELSSKRCSTKSPPTGGERAHQQEALQHQVSTHRGRESSSAAGAPAPNLQPQGARELSSRRSSAKSPTTGGAREELKSSRGTDIIPYPGGGQDLGHISHCHVLSFDCIFPK